MTLLAERFPMNQESVSGEGGGAEPQRFAALATPVEWMRWCDHCESEQHFKAGWFSLEGLVGVCLCCGTPDLAPNTRTTTEVA